MNPTPGKGTNNITTEDTDKSPILAMMKMCLQQQEALVQKLTENNVESLQRHEEILRQQTKDKEEFLRHQAKEKEESSQRHEEILRQHAKDKEEILRKQAKDKEELLRQHAKALQETLHRQQDKQDILQRFDVLVSRLDSLEKQAVQDREATQTQHAATQKLLQKQSAAIQATFQQSLTAPNAHILQIQSERFHCQ